MTRHARIACFALLIATALAAASFWGPWVDHPAAALQLSGQDLGEFVKFLPAIRQRERPLLRQVFYLQPLACALIYALLAGARASGFPRSVRTAALLTAPPLLLGLLPPVWGHPKDLFAREFAAQATGFLSGGILILAHGLYRRLSARTIGLAIGVLALVTALPSHWTFWSVKPLIWQSYATLTIHVGWGLWLNLSAWIAVCAASAWLILTPRPESHAGAEVEPHCP